MRRPNREINIFNMSMLDVISGALGAFLILMLIFMEYYEPRLQAENANLRAMVEQLEDSVDNMATAMATVGQQLAAANSQVDSLRQQMATLQDNEAMIAQLRQEVQQAQEQARILEQRLGVALQEREIVFLVDVSGSMNEEGPVNRLAQVVSGIKMLVATMGDDYRIDVVFFPNQGASAAWGAMWGQLRPVNDQTKFEVYQFLQRLVPDGGTPTGPALDAVVSGSSYRDARTVVLLSDGEPCVPNATGGCERDMNAGERDALVSRITAANGGRLTINTIGVGESFRTPNATGDAVRFLRSLAERNGGFYIGY